MLRVLMTCLLLMFVAQNAWAGFMASTMAAGEAAALVEAGATDDHCGSDEAPGQTDCSSECPCELGFQSSALSSENAANSEIQRSPRLQNPATAPPEQLPTRLLRPPIS